MTILSDLPDGWNFYYGFAPGDHRQINVRYEMVDGLPVAEISTPMADDAQQMWTGKKFGGWWVAYVGGEPIGCYEKKDLAEAAAIKFIEANPTEGNEE